MRQVSDYHLNNDLIGLTAWNSTEQAYYLVQFANVTGFFKTLSKQVTVPNGLVDAAHEFMSEYDPENEIVLLTLNEDLLTVSVVNKYEPPSKESLAEVLGWKLAKVQAFCYLESISKPMKVICSALDITEEEYDLAMEKVLG